MSRAALKTLSTLRGILHVVRDRVVTLEPLSVTAATASPLASSGSSSSTVINGQALSKNELQRGNAWWRREIISMYRGKVGLTNKSAVKEARSTAAAVLACFEAVAAQQELLDRYRGKEVDSKEQRDAVARFVGLQMPQTQPIASGGAASKYQSSVAERSADPDNLTGIDNLKAQLYGVDAVIAEKLNKSSS